MSEFVIITDSSSDLPAKVAESFGVSVIPLEVNIDDVGCKMNDEIDMDEDIDDDFDIRALESDGDDD